MPANKLTLEYTLMINQYLWIYQ